MNAAILKEAERYSFPIIILNEGEVTRNSAAMNTRSLSRVSPLSCLPKKTMDALLNIGERSAMVVKHRSNRRKALAFRCLGHLVFMYMPMFEHVVNLPREPFFLDASGNDLSELLSEFAAGLFPKNEIAVSSFARICSVCTTLAFSEDTVKHEIDCDGMINAERAFYAFGKVLSGIDRSDLSELRDPPIGISFSDGTLTLSLYGCEEWTEKTSVLAAVSPYSFTEREYLAAFILAVAVSIFKSRK